MPLPLRCIRINVCGWRRCPNLLFIRNIGYPGVFAYLFINAALKYNQKQFAVMFAGKIAAGIELSEIR